MTEGEAHDSVGKGWLEVLLEDIYLAYKRRREWLCSSVWSWKVTPPLGSQEGEESTASGLLPELPQGGKCPLAASGRMLNRQVCVAGWVIACRCWGEDPFTHSYTSSRLNQDWIKHLTVKICHQYAITEQAAGTATVSQLLIHSSQLKYILNTTYNWCKWFSIHI